jgi:PhnB protein
MPRLFPYIFSNDAKKQSQFYKKALNGEIVSLQTFGQMPNADEKMKDKIMHLVFKVGEVTFFMADSVMEDVKGGNQIDLALEFSTEEEAKQAFDNLAKDGQVIMPFEKQFWGAMFGRVKDQFGMHWQIVTEQERE